MTQQQFDVLLLAVLFAPFINKLLVAIANKIYLAYRISRMPKTKMGNDFVEALLEAVKKEKEKE